MRRGAFRRCGLDRVPKERSSRYGTSDADSGRRRRSRCWSGKFNATASRMNCASTCKIVRRNVQAENACLRRTPNKESRCAWRSFGVPINTLFREQTRQHAHTHTPATSSTSISSHPKKNPPRQDSHRRPGNGFGN